MKIQLCLLQPLPTWISFLPVDMMDMWNYGIYEN